MQIIVRVIMVMFEMRKQRLKRIRLTRFQRRIKSKSRRQRDKRLLFSSSTSRSQSHFSMLPSERPHRLEASPLEKAVIEPFLSQHSRIKSLHSNQDRLSAWILGLCSRIKKGWVVIDLTRDSCVFSTKIRCNLQAVCQWASTKIWPQFRRCSKNLRSRRRRNDSFKTSSMKCLRPSQANRKRTNNILN